MKNLKSGLFSLLIILLTGSLYAQISLPSIFNDSMVLQQNFETPIWGWAEPGTEITVSGNWSRMPAVTATTDEEGKWTTKIKTTSAGGPYELYINDRIIRNVMLGEVWICSGQSNMQMAIDGCENAEEEINKAFYPDIRFFYVGRDNADEPSKDCYGQWATCNPKSARSFSAVAYYFGREIYKDLKVPIGLIHVSWGGSTAQAWINHQILQSTPEGQYYIAEYQKEKQEAAPGTIPRDMQSPSNLYNAMLHPLIPFGIKGAIWYQGESNTEEHYFYKNVMTNLISNWRAEWKQGDFPFYYVQLAPFNYSKEYIGAALRDVQLKSLDIPNTGMAVTMDIGNPVDIHPIKKKEVGERLALWAMAKTYGKDDLVYSGPLYKSIRIEKDKAILSFDHIGSGLLCKGEKLSHFIIAGKDQVFYPAAAFIKGESIIVSNPKVENPIAVRYAFKNGDEPNLFNNEGLPASTFRTDDWRLITEIAKINSIYDEQKNGFIISITNQNENVIRYTTDGTEPTFKSTLYTKPFISTKNITIKAKVFVEDEPSLLIAEYKIHKHLATGKKLTYTNPYHHQYNGGGDYGLVNSVFGSTDFKDGTWQGFFGEDLEVIIDLAETKKIKSVGLNCLQVINSWIVFPKKVKVSRSSDGQTFHQVAVIENDLTIGITQEMMYEFKVSFESKEARYIKIQADNYGPLPDWHISAGEKSWLFVNEIIIE